MALIRDEKGRTFEDLLEIEKQLTQDLERAANYIKLIHRTNKGLSAFYDDIIWLEGKGYKLQEKDINIDPTPLNDYIAGAKAKMKAAHIKYDRRSQEEIE